jgi:hypothetical protein
MSIDAFVRRNLFPLLLLTLHTVLVGAYAWIELDHAWNDMNPTMLVMAALHVFDYPIHLVLHEFVNMGQQIGTYLATLLVLGGAFWFSVGWLISRACRAILHMASSRQPITNGA